MAVMLLWPVILPALLIGKLVKVVRKSISKRRKRQGDEESQMSSRLGVEKDNVSV